MWSCLKPESYPLEPIIVFESFTANNDSASLVISFTDGDGDIGLRDTDTSGSFNKNSKYHHNLFLEYYEKVNGNWEIGKDGFGEDIVFKYRTPYLTPEGNNKALKGTINVLIEPIYYNPFSLNSDTIMYKIILVDRNFNESNFVESNVITR